jgi:hypothetical protein
MEDATEEAHQDRHLRVGNAVSGIGSIWREIFFSATTASISNPHSVGHGSGCPILPSTCLYGATRNS